MSGAIARTACARPPVRKSFCPIAHQPAEKMLVRNGIQSCVLGESFTW